MGNHQPQLILASASSYRLSQLKQQFMISPKQVPTNIDETPLKNETAENTAIRLSEAKAKAAASLVSNSSIIIAADQTAEWNNTLIRKPQNHATAVLQLKKFSGEALTFYSGLCVFDKVSQRSLIDSVRTTVRFRKLNSHQIEAYIERDRPYDCVGAFKNESLGIGLFESISSEDPSALTGLPLIKLNHFLLEFGIDLLTLKTNPV